MQTHPDSSSEFIIHATDASFDRLIREAELPVVVDFWASWCAPCRFLGKALEEVAPDFQGKLQVIKVDVDANPATASRFDIQSIPTMAFFNGGDCVGLLPGALPPDGLRQVFGQHVKGELQGA
ncbi:MAG: thioredoxin domain-containing protein [Acidobacteriota bacterium]|nr:thioredoxin domain-containing protein [Acidobacteriota bacterium]MDQ7087975.1 thioredoxin domain-containing protein [Acidobacteriota bacterium]